MTGGIKIPVSADLSGVQQEVNKLGQGVKQATGGDMGAKAAAQMAAGMKQAAGSAEKVAQQLAHAKRLQEALGKQGKNVTPEAAAEYAKDYDAMRENASPAMKRKLTGMSFESILGDGWKTLGNNEAAARRMRESILRQIGLGGLNTGGGGGGGEAQQRRLGQYLAGALRQAGGGVFGALMPGGAAGAIVRGAASEAGGAGSIAAGGGRLLSGLGIAALAYGAIKGASAIKGHMDSAEQESISYADQLRRLGATPMSHDDLRDAVRGSSRELDLTYADGAKLAQGYVRSAGIDGLTGGQLRSELATAGGFGRSLGLDPEAGASLMGALRHNKVSGGDADNRRFAMLIGEAVAKAGVFTKADEVLMAVEGYTKEATRAALAPANTTGYVNALGSMLQGAPAGMDPSRAASLLSTVDNSFRHGGGEAQRNFMLGALQKSLPGLTAVDMGFMQDAGMFASADKVFGKDSVAYKSADEATRRRYDELAKNGGGRTFFDMAMGQLGGMSSDEQRMNMTGLMGLSNTDAAFLQSVVNRKGGLNSAMNEAASAYKLDPAKLSPGAQRNLLDVHYGTPEQLQKKVQWLKTQNLTEPEQEQLRVAEATGGHGLKSTLAKLGVKYGNDMTEGDVSRQNLAKMSNLASDVSTKLIPMTNAIREAVTWMASKVGFTDRYGNSEKGLQELTEQLAKVKDGDAEKIASLYLKEAQKVEADPKAYTPEYRQLLKDGIAENSKKIDPIARTPDGKQHATQAMAKDHAEFLRMTAGPAKKAADILRAAGSNIEPEWIQGQWAAETGWGANMLKGTNNLGNIKADKAWKGAANEFSVPEFEKDGTVSRKNEKFRTYGSLDESAEDWAKFMLDNRRRYAPALKAATPAEYGYEIGKSGYATNPGYGQLITGAIDGVMRRTKKKPVAPLTPLEQAGSDFKMLGNRMLEDFGGALVPRKGADEMASAPIPADAKRPVQQAAAGQAAPLTGEVTVHVLDQAGKPMAPPARVPISAPRAAGVRQQ